jgi:hypothetical protein
MSILYLLIAYLVCGVLFAVPFLYRWIEKTDESSAGASWGFRLIILPGCIVFWPLLLRKYIIARKGN